MFPDDLTQGTPCELAFPDHDQRSIYNGVQVSVQAGVMAPAWTGTQFARARVYVPPEQRTTGTTEGVIRLSHLRREGQPVTQIAPPLGQVPDASQAARREPATPPTAGAGILVPDPPSSGPSSALSPPASSQRVA